MGGEQNGAEETVEEQQGVEVVEKDDGAANQGNQTVTEGHDGDNDDGADKGADGGDSDGDGNDIEAEYRAALADRDKKIADLEAQIANAAKSVESANELAKQIEQLRADTDAERVGYELKLAGCRSVRAGRVLLAEHEGDMAALRKAEPWLFGETVGGGATGLEPAGASKGESDELKRWRAIAGLE